MKELINELKHKRDLIEIHKSAIALLDKTIAKLGDFTPTHIQYDRNERLKKVKDITNQTIEYLNKELDFNDPTFSNPGNYVDKLNDYYSIDIEAMSTLEIEGVYQTFNIIINALRASDPKIISNSPVRILFMAAQPDDNVRLQSEFDDIVSKVQLRIQDDSLLFLLPTWNTDYDKFLSRLNNDRPNVLHYSGHGDKDGIHLINNVNQSTQVLSNKYLDDIFEGTKNYLELVILNSCFSSEQADIISKHGIYVLGIHDIMDSAIGVELAKNFYLGFSAQTKPVSILKAIKHGCRNFSLNYPHYVSNITLWKDGKKINADQI
jgi:hypothetical protein